MNSNNNNNIEKMIERAMRGGAKTPSKTPLGRKNSIGNLEKMLQGTPAKTPSQGKKSPNINFDFFGETGFLSPVRTMPAKKTVNPMRKIAPKEVRAIKPKRKMAPPALIASPDRKFAHKFDGMNSGEKDSRGRIIYIGKAGGKYVLSTVGSRVPYVNEKLKAKANKGTLEFTGKYDREGLKIYKGKQGGLFVISPNSGKRKNPLRPFKNSV
ncbi:PBCV-specific basic adaptor domain-containing protein [Paramecium bursaria Chlorella virus CVR-1]|uniref:PBCV-specific basic adaptor domain-containing protein n=1 Tax=Paramecium bursaria Chlorella virus CVA-1 TaxID=42683 RepID=M1HLA7_9PHYC|nr:PBCV-specific basic adaptor domain-containing protein [Paramecium bursaria Chlorella virus CVA-1]AGE50471.1 PBCV-specific basic adaptor domain-containing protein [Paramecium bursaria Chlorella virus CVA-1]AGE52151.1 PBCV-specific basic adaptor domain-containing protein [Paramecium bursaria Chlorella virus CVR-1]